MAQRDALERVLDALELDGQDPVEAALLHDPDDLGDLIPKGLMGSDGYCFDLTEHDDTLGDYVRRRVHEAYENACNE